MECCSSPDTSYDRSSLRSFMKARTAPQTDTVFDGGSQWLAIAIGLRDRPLRFNELVDAIGLSGGAIHRQLGDMRRAGIVKADPPDGGRGAQFWLDPTWYSELDRAVANRQPLGVLVAGQPWIEVEVPEQRQLGDVINHSDLVAPIVWAAALEPPGSRFVLILDRKTSMTLVGRLRAALEAAGLRCTVGRVGEVLGKDDLMRAAAAWRTAVHQVLGDSPGQ